MAASKIKSFALTIAVGVSSVLGAFVLLLFTILRHPLTVFKKKNRDVAPSILLDSTLGTHQYVRANGIRFHYVEAGDKSKPLMLFLHGFPEFWFSWRHQLREFQKDYYTVAVDMRGYGDSDHPLDKKGYDLNNLVKDMVELISALGYSKCVLVSHDWGGMIAWRLVYRHPELVERFIVMNCPHPKVFSKMLSTNYEQLFRSSYVLLFQVPYLPELLFSLRDYRMLKSVFLGRKGGLVHNREDFSQDVIEAYKFVFSQPHGMTCPINYYRMAFRTKQLKEQTEETGRKISMPTLLIWGEDDAFMHSSMADSDRYQDLCADFTVKRIAGCSHWVQQDRPQLVNQFMREFLGSS